MELHHPSRLAKTPTICLVGCDFWLWNVPTGCGHDASH